MIKYKVALFFLTIIAVKFIFMYINDIGDKRIKNMKQLILFTDFLRIYSCEMKMSIEEIISKYNYKNIETEKVCTKFLEEIQNKNNDKIQNNYLNFVSSVMMTPEDFNMLFTEIIDYYGNTYSDILNTKLLYTKNQMEKKIIYFENDYKEKKLLYNKISLLCGCLIAIILI